MRGFFYYELCLDKQFSDFWQQLNISNDDIEQTDEDGGKRYEKIAFALADGNYLAFKKIMQDKAINVLEFLALKVKHSQTMNKLAKDKD